MTAPESKTFEYQGEELEIFAHATNWKTYFSKRLAPYIHGDVVEVGAGVGANSPFLSAHSDFTTWLALEPDGKNVSAIAKAYEGAADQRFRFQQGFVSELHDRSVDTILYIDVLEHIETDRAELQTAAAKLKPGGKIVVLSPAHQVLYSPFDRSIGHHRRYTKESLAKISPEGVVLKDIFYLDSVGLFASLANRFLLKQKAPSLKQILTWDRAFVPVSRLTDRLLMNQFGKTVVAVWSKT